MTHTTSDACLGWNFGDKRGLSFSLESCTHWAERERIFHLDLIYEQSILLPRQFLYVQFSGNFPSPISVTFPLGQNMRWARPFAFPFLRLSLNCRKFDLEQYEMVDS